VPLVDRSLRLSEIAEKLLHLDGKPFSLANYPMYRAVYDGRFRDTLLMCGRQVAKSTSLANFIISESVAIPFFREYYVSPSREQTLVFSHSRVGKTITYSPLIQKLFQSRKTADRVLHRSYTNGSENAFTYACDDADRARGYSADRALFDEVQDILYEKVIPVVLECMANSDYKFATYAGTPKTMEASIQFLWEMSSQSEWVMRCQGCGKHSFVASERAIGKTGPICLACGKNLNPRLGFWIDMKRPEPGIRQLKGFHVPRPIMPSDVPAANPPDAASQEAALDRWNDILHKLATYPPALFRNEVLGISDAQGKRLISLEELQALCTGPSVQKFALRPGVTITTAGIDWSGGGTTGVSRTVLWIWGWNPQVAKLQTLFFRIYPGQHSVADVKDLISHIGRFQCAMIAGDAGEGALPNSMVRDTFGPHRCTMVQYGAFAEPTKWNGIDRWLVDRTTLIDTYLMLMKRRGTELPPFEEAREPVKDILNVFEEITSAGRKVWRHSPQLPDDSLHAQVFGWFAWKLLMGDLKFYS
jgi:hypothetical protein